MQYLRFFGKDESARFFAYWQAPVLHDHWFPIIALTIRSGADL